MKRILIAFLFTYCFTFIDMGTSFGQCHIEVNDGNGFRAISLRPEILYKTGNKSIIGNVSWLVPADSGKKIKIVLVLKYLYTGDENRMELRQIVLKFKNNKSYTLTASQLGEPEYNNGVSKESGYFSIGDPTDGLGLLLTNNSLESITVSDNRTKKSILMKPYERILVEQNLCIYQKAYGG